MPLLPLKPSLPHTALPTCLPRPSSRRWGSRPPLPCTSLTPACLPPPALPPPPRGRQRLHRHRRLCPLQALCRGWRLPQHRRRRTCGRPSHRSCSAPSLRPLAAAPRATAARLPTGRQRRMRCGSRWAAAAQRPSRQARRPAALPAAHPAALPAGQRAALPAGRAAGRAAGSCPPTPATRSSCAGTGRQGCPAPKQTGGCLFGGGLLMASATVSPACSR